MNTNFQLAPAFRQQTTLSPTLQINERVQALWAAGQPVYHLGFGESRFPVHAKILTALQANAQQQSYLAGQGLPALRNAVAAFYSCQWQSTISPSQIIVGPGSKSLIFAAQMALDAELLLPTPSWVSYGPQAKLLGRAVRMIPASAADEYALTVDALDQTVQQSTAPTKLLILNSPCNPTGQMLAPELVKALADYCRQQGIVVLSDEIYALTAHGHRPHVSIAQHYPEGTITLGGLSKHLSLGGWRLGVAVLPETPAGKALMQAMRIAAGEIWSTPSAPVQYAAVTAYSDDPEISAYIQECTQLHAIRTQYIWSWLVELGIPCAQPDGAFYLFPNFETWRSQLAARGVHTSPDLATYLLEQHQIATLPGTAFGLPPEALSLRLASSYLDMETAEKAETLLAVYRTTPNPETLMEAHHPQTNQALQHLRQFITSLQ
jgi:aspartate aminotransferase